MIVMPMNRLARPAVCWLFVLALCMASFLVARKTRKPFSSTAPSYRTLGPANAKVTIVEFSDFECPACKVAERPLRTLLNLYNVNIRLVFKHFPLESRHTWARAAAIAAECAGRQGKFWQFHHELYDRQEEWPNAKSEEVLVSFAKKLDIDTAAWLACRRDPAVNEAVSADYRDGMDAWVGSTPTFFINGKRFVGALQLSERATSWIDMEMKK